MESSTEGKALTFRMWHQELRNHLIEQGMQGFKQKAIITAFSPRVHPEDLKAYLELLLKEDKVQKFKYKGDYWWRATIEILKEEV